MAGRFLLRIEDLDPDRSRPEWESAQLSTLAELGLDWDGAVVRQSERRAAYADALAVLEGQGRVYPCFCSRAEIRAAASAPHGVLAPHQDAFQPTGALTDPIPPAVPAGAYPGTCRTLSAAERTRRIRRGERHGLRFDAAGEHVAFTDRFAGLQSWVVDDFVLSRADGVFAYQLAVVVDDGLQGITQVVRGADLLDSVGRQILLMRALGQPERTEWAHLPLVIGPDGRRLAKRSSSEAPPSTPGATLGWLAASLGIVSEHAPASAVELLDDFDPARIPPAPVILG